MEKLYKVAFAKKQCWAVSNVFQAHWGLGDVKACQACYGHHRCSTLLCMLSSSWLKPGTTCWCNEWHVEEGQHVHCHNHSVHMFDTMLHQVLWRTNYKKNFGRPLFVPTLLLPIWLGQTPNQLPCCLVRPRSLGAQAHGQLSASICHSMEYPIWGDRSGESHA